MFWQRDFDLWCIYRIWLWASILYQLWTCWSQRLPSAQGGEQGEMQRTKQALCCKARLTLWACGISQAAPCPSREQKMPTGQHKNKEETGKELSVHSQRKQSEIPQLVGFMVRSGGQLILPNPVLSRHSTEKKHVVILSTYIYCSHSEL